MAAVDASSSLLTVAGHAFWKQQLLEKRPGKLVDSLMEMVFTKLHSKTDAVWTFLKLKTPDSSVDDASRRRLVELRNLFDDAFKYGGDAETTQIRKILRSEFKTVIGDLGPARRGLSLLDIDTSKIPSFVTVHVEGRKGKMISVSRVPWGTDAEQRKCVEKFVETMPAFTHAYRRVMREPGDDSSDSDS